MPGKATVLDILSNEDAPAADHALLAALRKADLPAAQAIVEAPLARNQRAGLRGLVAAFHEFDESIRQHLLGEMDKLFSVLREGSQSYIEQVRLNVLAVIRRGCAYRAAYLVDGALRDRSSRVREAAAETLYALVEQLQRTSPVADGDFDHLGPEEIRSRMADLESYAEDRRQVVSAIESGLESFSLHHHPSVVEMAMWFVDDLGAKFWAIVAAPGSRLARVAMSVLAGSKDPRLVPFCISALNYGAFRAQVAKELATCTDPAFLAQWLRESWRLVQPKAARGIAALKELSCVQDSGAMLSQLPADTQRHIPRWISATGISSNRKLDLFHELQRRGEPQAQRAAAWGLTTRMDHRATSLLRTLSRSQSPRLSRIARYELARRLPLEYPPAELISMPDGGLSDDGAWGETGPTMTFEQYWAKFDQLSEEDRRRLGEGMFTGHPSDRAILDRGLVASAAADRLRAVRIITIFGIAGEFAEQLYRLSYDNDPEVRSAAVTALGQVPNAATNLVLRNALIDQDSRVQANAVEAVERSGAASSATNELLPKLASPDNRVRANAVKALLKLGVREAAETLLLMLEDKNRAQRVSALWLIDNMGLFTLANRVIKAARSDEDAQIRQRARAMADRLLEQPPASKAGQETTAEVASSTS